jgi:predicted nucleic acid-binding protein
MAEAEAVLRKAHTIFGPTVLRQEFYNAVHRGVRRGTMSADAAVRCITRFTDANIQESYQPEWIARAYEVAQRFRQPRIFDAIYYVCAEDLGVELWTADRKFVETFGLDRPGWLRLCPDDLAAGARV